LRNPKRCEFIKSLANEKESMIFFSVQEAYAFGIVEMGENVIIHDGAVIGTDGFGFERDADGKLVRFPHYGKVKIGDNVDIYPNVVISRGNIGDTVIGSGTKICGNVQVGHNSQIGNDVLIGPHTTICGSVKIEKCVNIWSYALICPHVTVGAYSEIGSYSFVNKDIPHHVKAMGQPAKYEKGKTWSTV